MKLQQSLKDKKYTSVELYFDDFDSFEEAITELTHRNRNKDLGIKFSNDKNKFYISTLGVLSWGVSELNKWKKFNTIEDIIFSDFSKNGTFNLIKEENTNKIINNILN